MPMINCSDCNKEMSDSATLCPNCGKPNINLPVKNKPVSILLGVGILFIPIIFAWFTLRKGYSNKAKIISFSWLIISLLIIGAKDGKSSNHESQKAMSAQSAPEQPASEPVMQVKINDILSAYKNNEVGADNQYKGNLIQVTGVVDDIKKDIMNSLYVTIGTGEQFEIPQIQAFFDDSMNNQLAQLKKRQKITVICRVNGLMFNVLAKECIIK